MVIWTRSGHCVILGLGGVKLLCILHVGFWAEPSAKVSDLVHQEEPRRSSGAVSADVATLDSQCRHIGLMSRHRVMMLRQSSKSCGCGFSRCHDIRLRCHDTSLVFNIKHSMSRH